MTDYLPTVGGTNATQGNGPLAGQTLNFDLNLVNFDWTTWYNYEWENWVAVDALLNVAIGFLNIRGIWQANTAYTAGETVFDPNDVEKLYLCEVTHTSGTVFATDIAAYWVLRTDINPVVTSVHARIGDVVSVFGDYTATEIEYDDSVTTWGATNLQAIIALMTTYVELNATNIGLNAADIAQAEADITQNTIDIAGNAADIVVVAAAATANGIAIAANDADITAMEANRLRINGTIAMTGALDMGANKITELAAGTDPGDAVRFDQVGLPIPSLTGNPLKALRANAAEDDLEFVDVTAAGWALLDDADAEAQRTTLGLGTASLMIDSADEDLAVDPDGAARRDIVAAAIAAGGPAITTTVISNDATIDFTWSGTPRLVVFRFVGVRPATDAVILNARFRIGGSYVDAAGSYAYAANTSDSVNAPSGNNSDTSIAITSTRDVNWHVGNAAGEGLNGKAEINSPSNDGHTTITTIGSYETRASSLVAFVSSGKRKANSVVDGVRFSFSAGNMQDGTIIMEVYR